MMGLGYFRRLRLPGRRMPSQRAACAWLAALAFALFSPPAQAQVETDTGTALTQAAILDKGSVANVADPAVGNPGVRHGAECVRVVTRTMGLPYQQWGVIGRSASAEDALHGGFGAFGDPRQGAS